MKNLDKNLEGLAVQWTKDREFTFLTKEKLFEALYQLADQWCPSIDQYEYQEFFHLLKFKIKYSNQGDGNAYDNLN